jgi:hypothetical protein
MGEFLAVKLFTTEVGGDEGRCLAAPELERL